MKLKLNNKGLSLPLTLGLLLLLITITTTLNELVIRALRASHQIEAADKAYFAAEGGIEDALYELSPHTAGYESGASLGEIGARSDEFSQDISWKNEWEIKNKGLNTCTDALTSWAIGYAPDFCGRLYEGDKLVINLFTDDALSTGVSVGEINETIPDIHTLSVSNIMIRFRIPEIVIAGDPNAFTSGLLIDNDGDLGVSSLSGPPPSWLGLNEDGRPDYPFWDYSPVVCPFSGGEPIDDNDCDLLEDEDSPEDPVLLWKVVDGSGHSFQPLRGCKGSPIHSSHPGFENAILCERGFELINGELSATLSGTDEGTDEIGNILSLQNFLANYAGLTETLQMEILEVAPLQAVSQANGYKISIPYLEYGISYTAFDNSGVPAELPSTFFAVRSDGYYQDFKQSITTNVVPRATTQLLDLTIIQQ